jgi:integrase/recombinase XerD
MRKPIARTALDASITEFVSHQRAFGRDYRTAEYHLKAFARFVARQRVADLTAKVFERWCKSVRRLSPNTRYPWQLLIRQLCLFRRRREPRCFVPDASGFARRQPPRPPVIVTPAQVLSALRAADALPPSYRSPMRQAALRIAIVLLYTAGLRRGELVHVQMADVDSQEGVLHIRDSKCHKSRWVPLSNDACREVRIYLKKRMTAAFDQAPAAPFLCHRGRGGRTQGYCGPALRQAIEQIFKLAGVQDAMGRRPRVQDVRHSFAVNALIRKYREGGDVQTHLPKLALYMGHVSIVSTAYYLHFIPEVAALAGERFSGRFSHIIDKGGVL